MNKQEAEAMRERIAAKAPHLEVQVVPCLEIFGEPDDGTWCCEMVAPGEPRPTDICRLYARVVENEHQWETTQRAWAIGERMAQQGKVSA